ncbi:MAG TPA: hypothetical protein VGK54_00410, partial [Chloroflexota bacterium]
MNPIRLPEMPRRTFLGVIAGSLLAAPLAAGAQQPQSGTVRRIGVLMYQSRTDEFVPLFAA